MQKKTKRTLLTLGVTAALAAAIPMGANASEAPQLTPSDTFTFTTTAPIAGAQAIRVIGGGEFGAVEIKRFDIGELKSAIAFGGQFDSPEILELLGTDAETLRKELESGKSLLDIAESKGISKQTLLQTQVDAMMKQVKEGITKQAEALITRKGNEPLRIQSMPGISFSIGGEAKAAIRIGSDLKDLLAFLGIDEETYMTELKSGKSLLDIAGTKGITKEQLIAFETEQFNKSIDEAVANGKLNAEEATKMKEDFAANVEKRITGQGVFFTKPVELKDGAFGQRLEIFSQGLKDVMPLMQGKIGVGGSIAISLNNEELLKFLGIDQETFLTELKSGKSLLDIAGTKGITKEQLIAFETEQFNKKIDEAVAGGKLTAEQAAKLKEENAANVEQRISGGGLGFGFSISTKPIRIEKFEGHGVPAEKIQQLEKFDLQKLKQAQIVPLT
ncbi:hypothetical protein [Paenibacillus koleovorans]|uniref:hypothetical protein n=1 Tax=Paenibacillus koleovorans TaxID=121608 RepID=UPI000FDBF2AD|nr:hypothetical protein [Paenibacillus koleovorans]